MKLKVTNQKIEIINPASLYMVAGSVGLYTIDMEFSSDWDGYTKTVIFQRRFSNDTESIVLTEDFVEVPAGMLTIPCELSIGVYGVKGDLEKPTLWSGPYKVEVGCMEGNPISDPDTDIYTQILAEFGRLLNLTATSESNVADVSVVRDLINDHYNFSFNFEFPTIIDCGSSTEVIDE